MTEETTRYTRTVFAKQAWAFDIDTPAWMTCKELRKAWHRERHHLPLCLRDTDVQIMLPFCLLPTEFEVGSPVQTYTLSPPISLADGEVHITRMYSW